MCWEKQKFVDPNAAAINAKIGKTIKKSCLALLKTASINVVEAKVPLGCFRTHYECQITCSVGVFQHSWSLWWSFQELQALKDQVLAALEQGIHAYPRIVPIVSHI